MAKTLVEVYGCTVLASCEVVGLTHSSFTIRLNRWMREAYRLT